MSRDEDLERWEEEETSLAEMRGVLTFDSNNHLVLVQADVEATAGTLAEMRCARLLRADVTGQEVELTGQCFFVFRLKGHSWTEILDRDLMSLSRVDAEELSRRLRTRAIYYGVSDVALAMEYALYENGALLERLETDENGPQIFESRLRDVSVDTIDDEEELVHQFFKDLDALEPGIRFIYLVGHVAPEAGEVVSLQGAKEYCDQVAFVAL